MTEKTVAHTSLRALAQALFDAEFVQEVRAQMTFPRYSALRRELNWSRYKSLLRIFNVAACDWYVLDAVEHDWRVRVFDRQLGARVGASTC